MSRTRALSLLAALAAVVLIAAPTVVARDENNDNAGGRSALSAEPWIYVGNAGDCGLDYPAGSRIVTSGWLGGMGLPDDGTTANTLAAGPG
ncbi:MAG TPA: hypothetical protein VGC90_09685, partial [Candidatus Limnocylindrales bacterium]